MVCSAALLLLLQPDPAALIHLYEQALAAKEEQFGPEHPAVARAASDLGLFLRDRRGEPYLLRALAIDEKVLGPDARETGEDLENLASVLPPVEALPLYRRAARHKDPAIAARNLARLAAAENRPDLYREALAKEEIASGPAHPRVAVRLNDLALVSDPAAAEPMLRRALAIQEKVLGPLHPETAVTLSNLASLLLATGRIAEAEPAARRALVILEDKLGPAHPRIATASSNLADVLRARKQYAAARRLYERALAIDEQAYGPAHAEVAVDLENLAALLEETGDAAAARKLRDRARSITAK